MLPLSILAAMVLASPPLSVVEENPQARGGSGPGLALVFVPHGQSSRAELDEDVARFMAALRSAEPWASYSGLRVFRLLPVAEAATRCSVVREHALKPHLRCDRGLAPLLDAAGLPPGYKIVVLSRSAVDPAATVSAPGVPSVVFFGLAFTSRDVDLRHAVLHEMGHAFGLRDEEAVLRVDHASAARTPGRPNCAPDRATAATWWGDVAGAGYYLGCAGSKRFVRPTADSFMTRSGRSESYGPVSLRWLTEALRSHYAFR